MQKQKQIDVNWDHRGHTRSAVGTGFQTAGLWDRTVNAVTNPLESGGGLVGDTVDGLVAATRKTTPDWGPLTYEGPDDPSASSGEGEVKGFDRFGTPVTDAEDVATDDPDGVGPLGVPTKTWILGGAGVVALAGVAMVYTGDDNSLDVQRFNPRNSN